MHAASAVVGTGTPGFCTEAAFDTALATANSCGTITFNCGAAVKTITFTNPKNILANVTINGNDLIILYGGNTTRLLYVNGGLTFHLQHITLSNGKSVAEGGAVYSIGSQVFLESAQLLNNNATNQGGAVYCHVGTGGTLTISDRLFESNTSQTGRAIFNDGCVAVISNSTFKTNQASSGSDGFSGGIHNAAPATLTISNSLFQGNSALDGGGLYIATGSTTTLNTITLKSNTSGYGGVLENRSTVTLNDSLVDANIAPVSAARAASILSQYPQAATMAPSAWMC